MYRLQYKGWSGMWYTVRRYKTKRAAAVNLVKRKFEMPVDEWRISTEPDLVKLAKLLKEQKDGNQI